MREVTKTERGWAGHFICAHMCSFRRNTLLESGDTKIIVSTVGSMRERGDGEVEKIGYNRHYETMAFHAKFDDPYWDVDVSRQISFESEWAIEGVEQGSDQTANDMHEAVVAEVTARLAAGTTYDGDLE